MMINHDTLNVWFNQILVGQIWRDTNGMMEFRYDNQWLKDGFAISQQLPLTQNSYSSTEGVAHRYFVNLLPEADARIHITRDLKITNSDFELLKAIGGECAGALSILPTDFMVSKQAHYEKITDEKLKQIILRKGRISSFNHEKEYPRLLLAGAQDKCAILFNGKDYFYPKGAAASTHILKFEMQGYRNVPIYEYFLNALAKKLNLPVVDIELKKNDKDFFLLIKRYDRILNKDKEIQRLHQEDFCQALDISYERKYQQDGGPSFYDCYQLVQEISTNPINDTENLLKWQIFNVLAGNSDGHIKNLAFIYDKNHQVQLAPFYDLVCTRAIERVNPNLALSVADEFNPNNITLHHWKELAKQSQIRERYVINTVKKIANQLVNKFSKTQEEFEHTYGSYPALQRIKKIVYKQCNKIS